jgi:hypothetical protein
MLLHQQSSYAGVSEETQQLHSRMLWLLFVTERGVCLLHKLPVVIKTNISLPLSNIPDESHILSAFIKLTNLFRIFDQSGLFDIVQDRNMDLPSLVRAIEVDQRLLERLQHKLQDVSADLHSVRDVQRADIYVTQHWMKMILWKLCLKNLQDTFCSPNEAMSVAFPLKSALEFVNTISRLPRSAIEAHGFGMVRSCSAFHLGYFQCQACSN